MRSERFVMSFLNLVILILMLRAKQLRSSSKPTYLSYGYCVCSSGLCGVDLCSMLDQLNPAIL